MNARAFVVAVAAAVLLVPAAGSATSAAKTIGTRGYVLRIAADGARVAIHVSEGDFERDACEHASAWTPSANTITRLPEDECDEQSDFAFDGLTIAGARVAWGEYDSGNHGYCYGPYTTTLGKKTKVDLDRCGGDDGETGENWTFAGDGELLVGAYLQACDPCLDDEGNEDPDAEEPVALYRVTSGLRRLTRPKEDVTLLDVDASRFLTLEGGTLVVYSSTGRRLRSIAAGARTGGLTGNDVVAVAGRVLKVYDATTGRLRMTRTLAAGAVLRDVDQGYAVYSAGGTLRLLRLRDGKDAGVSRVRNLVDADLEPGGLFYAHNSGKGDKPGRVTFIPRANLPK